MSGNVDTLIRAPAARALLSFAWNCGFLTWAVVSLARTAALGDRKVRKALGLS